MSNILKSSCDPGSISTGLRLDMVKLTNLTEEFAILLHVSSTSIPHSNSPTSKFSTSLAPHSPPEDNQLSSSLSRARNAHPAHSSSPPHPTPASETFPTVLTVPAKNFNARRLRHNIRETLNDSTVTDPG